MQQCLQNFNMCRLFSIPQLVLYNLYNKEKIKIVFVIFLKPVSYVTFLSFFFLILLGNGISNQNKIQMEFQTFIVNTFQHPFFSFFNSKHSNPNHQFYLAFHTGSAHLCIFSKISLKNFFFFFRKSLFSQCCF